MFRFRLLVPALLLAGCSAAPRSSSAPAVGPNYGDQHTYASVGLGLAVEDFDLPSGFDADESFVADVRLGSRLHPNLAAEVQFEYLDEFEVDMGSTPVADVDGWSVSGNLKAYATTSRIQPYALIGFGLLKGEIKATAASGLDDSETDVFTRLGVGVDTILSDELTLGVEGSYVLPFDDLEDFNFFVLGVHLGWRF